MGEIQEVFEDLKDGMGKKGFLIFIGVAVVFGLYNLVKGSQSSDNLVAVRTVTSYPDAVTNANVIIDTLQNSIDYSENVIVEEIQGLETNLSTQIGQGFEVTNQYIQNGFDSQNKLLEESFDEIHGSLEGITEKYKELEGDFSKVSSSIGSISQTHAQIQSSIDSMKKDLTTGNTTIKPVETKPTTTPTTTTKPAEKKPASTNTYTYKTKAGLNTSTSIVDALKATGADSSFASRAKIAEANGISNYTGSYTQNVTLLNKLKSGSLKKV